MTVALAGEIRFKSDVRRTVNSDIESKITDRVVIQTTTGYVAFRPDLFPRCRGK
jgi:hypothetical protein